MKLELHALFYIVSSILHCSREIPIAKYLTTRPTIRLVLLLRPGGFAGFTSYRRTGRTIARGLRVNNGRPDLVLVGK